MRGPVIRKHPAFVRVFPIIALAAICAGSGYGAVHFDGGSSGFRSLSVFNNGSEDHWSISSSPTTVRMSMGALGLDWKLRLTHDHTSGDLKFSDPDGLSMTSRSGKRDRFAGNLVLFEPTTTAEITAGLWHGKLTTELTYRFRHNLPSEWLVGATVRPIEALEVGIRRSWLHPEPSMCRLFYEYDDGDIRSRVGGRLLWAMPVQMMQLSLVLAPTERLRLRSEIRDADLTPSAPEAGADPPGTYRAALEGLYYDGAVEGEYLLSRDWIASIRYRRLRLDTRLLGYDGGMIFAHFGVVAAEVEQQAIGISYRRWSTEVQKGSGDASLKGNVEIWPFVDGLIGLLGERRQIVADASVSWKALAINGPLIDRRRFTCTGSLLLLRIEPDVAWKTWRPAAFGFGVADLRSDDLALIRADLIQVRLSPTVHIGSFALAFNIAQWIPVAVRERDDDSSSGGSSGSGGGDGLASGNGGDGLWGGFSASVQLSTGD